MRLRLRVTLLRLEGLVGGNQRGFVLRKLNGDRVSGAGDLLPALNCLGLLGGQATRREEEREPLGTRNCKRSKAGGRAVFFSRALYGLQLYHILIKLIPVTHTIGTSYK